MRLLLLLVASTCVPFLSAAQPEAQILKALTDNSYKHWWQGEEPSIHMKGSKRWQDAYDSGVRWTFKLEERQVFAFDYATKSVVEESKFTLKQLDSYKWEISFGEHTYRLVLKDLEYQQELILRSYSGTSKTDELNDITLTYLKDE